MRLRKVRPTDQAYFARWWRDPRLQHLTSGDKRKLSDKQIHDFFEKLATSTSARHWMVEHENQTIGHVTIRGARPVEVQIVIGDPMLWGRGYGTEIAAMMKPWFTRLKIAHARMYVWEKNNRSIALGQKFGFQFTGSVTRRAGKERRKYLRMDWKK